MHNKCMFFFKSSSIKIIGFQMKKHIYFLATLFFSDLPFSLAYASPPSANFKAEKEAARAKSTIQEKEIRQTISKACLSEKGDAITKKIL